MKAPAKQSWTASFARRAATSSTPCRCRPMRSGRVSAGPHRSWAASWVSTSIRHRETVTQCAVGRRVSLAPIPFVALGSCSSRSYSRSHISRSSAISNWQVTDSSSMIVGPQVWERSKRRLRITAQPVRAKSGVQNTWSWGGGSSDSDQPAHSP